LIKWLEPDVLNLNLFWPRPGTSAAKMRQLKPGTGRERTRKIAAVFEKILLKKNEAWIGWTGDILIDEIGKKGGFVGRNFAYKPIVIKEKVNLGYIENAKIISATIDYLLGQLYAK
jgi:tRNA A37 methylthiotransferase MiaB